MIAVYYTRKSTRRKKIADNNKYLLAEVIEREISAPVWFHTYKEAYEEMRCRCAQAAGINLDRGSPRGSN